MSRSMQPPVLALALAAAGLLAASCGGAAKCSITFSGAFSGTYSCTATGAYGNAGGTNSGTAALLVNASGALSYYSFGLNTPADLHTGTYSPDPTLISNSSLLLANNQRFSEVTIQSNNTGTFSLKLDGLDTVSSTNGKAYLLHGTLDQTMPASGGGAAGTVTVHASF